MQIAQVSYFCMFLLKNNFFLNFRLIFDLYSLFFIVSSKENNSSLDNLFIKTVINRILRKFQEKVQERQQMLKNIIKTKSQKKLIFNYQVRTNKSSNFLQTYNQKQITVTNSITMDFFTSLNFAQVDYNCPLFNGVSLDMSQPFGFEMIKEKDQSNSIDETAKFQSPETTYQSNFGELSQSFKFIFENLDEFVPKQTEKQTNGVSHNLNVMEQQQWINKIGRTNNMARFILRCIKKYYNQDLYQVIKQGEAVPLRIKQFFDRFKSRNKLPSLAVLQKLLNRSHNTQGDPLLNRKIIEIILKKRAKKEIIENKRIKTKKLHMVSSKIYRLRCQSSGLIGRASWK